MNLTLQILVAPSQHRLGDPKMNARRYEVGDIVCVWDADIVAPYNGANHVMRDVISGGKFAFVHIREVPSAIDLDRARAVLLATDEEFGFFDGEITVLGYHRRKRFGAMLWNLPAINRHRLMSEKQITITWQQARNCILNIRENRRIADGDL